jgi:hypothetical protein
MIRMQVPRHIQYNLEVAPKAQTRVFVWIGGELTDLLERLGPVDLHVQSKAWLAVLFVVACNGTGVVSNPSDMVAKSSARHSPRNPCAPFINSSYSYNSKILDMPRGVQGSVQLIFDVHQDPQRQALSCRNNAVKVHPSGF